MSKKIKPNHDFWANLNKIYPNRNDNLAISQFLLDNEILYTKPNKGAYKINIDTKKCRALMFYPKTGKLVIQLNGENRAISFISDNPIVLINKIKSFL